MTAPDDCERCSKFQTFGGIFFFSIWAEFFFLHTRIEACGRDVMSRDKKMDSFDSHLSFCCDRNSSRNVQIPIRDAIYTVQCTLINETIIIQ